MSRIEAACSLTDLASFAAAGPWRIVQPGAVRERIVVLIASSSITRLLLSAVQTGRLQPDGSPLL